MRWVSGRRRARASNACRMTARPAGKVGVGFAADARAGCGCQGRIFLLTTKFTRLAGGKRVCEAFPAAHL